MMIGAFSSIVAGVSGVVLCAPAAHGADKSIVSVLGEPGTQQWQDHCVDEVGAPDRKMPVEPDGDLRDGLLDCSTFTAPGECMHRVDIDPTEFPEAVCSDGTMASFYIRAANGDEGRWVVHLQGGGGCSSEAECKDRWCGSGFYTAANMSNDWDRDGVPDRPEQAWSGGISSPLPANDFATWNHVYVPYCSSDLWVGRADDVALGSFTVHARGHAILHAVRMMLRKNNPNIGWQAADGNEIADIDSADEILLSGTSAGGYGVLQNGDWFFNVFQDKRTAILSDAAIDVHPAVLTSFGVTEKLSNTSYASARLALYETHWQPGGYWHAIDGYVDTTCRNNHSLAECSSPSLLLTLDANGDRLIETPVFLRLDLEDGVLSDWIIGHAGTPINPDGHIVEIGLPGVQPTLQDYTEMMRETMVLLVADVTAHTSVFAPRCGKHVGLEGDNAFGSWTTQDTTDTPDPVPRGPASTVEDAVLEWFDPGGTLFLGQRYIDTDSLPKADGSTVKFSTCP